MALAIVALSALIVGFLTGLLTFKRSEQWCTECGETKRCPKCIPLPMRARTR